MFELDNARGALYQWDVDQRVSVDSADIVEVHFTNAVTAPALVCEVYEEGGRRWANIPNILLQQGWAVKVYGCCGECVRAEATIPVIRRTKPADYVYTETEVKRYDDLEQRISALEERDYLTTEADPTVPEWAKQPEKPTYTAAEVGAQPKGDYALRSELPTVPVQSVNGKTGAVRLSASDVGALPADTPIPAPYTLPTASDTVKGGVKVGEGLQMTGDVLGVVPEGEYELIEKITSTGAAIMRTNEPDGTPYNFKAVLIRLLSPGSITGRGLVYTYSGVLMVGIMLLTPVDTGEPQRSCMDCYARNGLWHVEEFPWTPYVTNSEMTQISINAATSYTHTQQEAPTITRVVAMSLDAGITIEILGARA